MNQADNKLQSLWQEFVRRRVVRVAIFYGAAAWVAVQVAELFLQAFDAENLLRYFVAAALVGFPVAVVLSWMFDITPHGIQRTPPISKESDGIRSIAVLPFANFSDDPSNEYFSDGLTEEIRDQLSKVPGLRVAARTSSFAFKGRNEDVREIGRRLDVGLVVEGGVRRHEDTVRISAQLVDTEKGYQLWSATFERQLEDIFRLQSEISSSILESVHLRVLDHGGINQPTSDFEAYNLYLLGRHHFHKRTELALSRAVEYFTEARNRDPQFALAYSGLADAMSLMSTGYYGNLPVADSIAKALPAAQQALVIAPDCAEAHASMGLIRHNQRDLEGAISSLQHAIKLKPTYTMAHVWLGVVMNSIGRYKEAAERNRAALRLDPLSPIINTNAGIDAARFGDFRESETRFRNAIELEPSFPVPYSGMARLKAMNGALDEAMPWMQLAIDRAPTRAFYLARKGFMYLQLEQLDLAEEWFVAARHNAADWHFFGDADLALLIACDKKAELQQVADQPGAQECAQSALVAWLLGNEQAALSLYNKECAHHELLLFEVINDEWVWRFPHSLYRAHLQLRLGDQSASANITSFLTSLNNLAEDGIVNPNTEYWAVVALVALDRNDEALQRLETAIERGWRNHWWARRDPSLAALQNDRRFESLLAQVAKLNDASLQRLTRSGAESREATLAR
ncbi:MAG: tetratricopeptide repeat protein [Gammaproteobacteria bacterium]|nr:tetratricopeptide repeat protein [Gammaproteobacteria bacterium]MDH4316120.1 tetratricopeptide repeat protein [Gammaproteobacteria bacterium]